MAHHFVSKRKRRPKSGTRQDTARHARFSAFCKANPLLTALPVAPKPPLGPIKIVALDMSDAKRKLQILGTLIPSADERFTNYIGEFLAGYLNPQLVPMGFVMGVNLALYDLQTGVNGFTGKPISGSIAGYPPIMYRLVADTLDIGEIAEAIFPDYFAAEIKKTLTDIAAKSN